MVILDISDVAHPQKIGQLPFTPPFISNIGAHSVVVIPPRNLALVDSESSAHDCNEALNHAPAGHLSGAANPTLLSVVPLPGPPRSLPHPNCTATNGRLRLH